MWGSRRAYRARTHNQLRCCPGTRNHVNWARYFVSFRTSSWKRSFFTRLQHYNHTATLLQHFTDP